MPLPKVGRRDALTKREFHQRLRTWLDQTEEDRVGDQAVQGRAPWVHVRDQGRLFRLHADAGRSAVEDYLDLVDEHGDDLAWTVVPNARGNLNAVAYGPEPERVRPFYLYLCS